MTWRAPDYRRAGGPRQARPGIEVLLCGFTMVRRRFFDRDGSGEVRHLSGAKKLRAETLLSEIAIPIHALLLLRPTLSPDPE